MDKGRQIDHIQNVNARFIDNFGASQKTSVKIANPPGKILFWILGGKSSFSLGWDFPEAKPSTQKKVETKNYNNYQDDNWNNSNSNTYSGKKQVEDIRNNPNVKNVYNNVNFF